MKVLARYKKRNGEEIQHPCEFQADEWDLLARFAVYAAELCQTTLLANPSRLDFSLQVDAAGVMTFVPREMPHPDHFRALLLMMRPFVLKGEATHVGRIRNILSRRLDHPAFGAYLERQKEIFDGARWQQFNIVADGTQINSSETMELWLNGYEYHRDPEKRAKFEALHQEPQGKEFSEALYVAMMLDRARVVVELRQAIEALRQNVTVVPLPGDSAAV